MKKFDEKKLLILGSNTMAPEAVQYAKTNGAYTIVTDYLPPEKSQAKQIADEVLDISTANTEELVAFCRQNNVDGVFAGISEFNLIQAQRISEALGLRFYFNADQWDAIEKKDQFKALCKKCGVQAPKEWFSGVEAEFASFDQESLAFPVVVKPVDGSASQGVTICENRTELDQAVSIAFEISSSKRIIIEEFVQGYEFTAHYTICKGKAALACIDNRYPVALHEGNVTTIPIARVYPALFQEQFIKKMNPSLVSMCESIGLDTAIIFVQGLYNDHRDEFYIFEAGLRSAAESPCRFIEHITGQNHYYMLIDYILLGTTDYDLSKEKPDLDNKCCAIVSFASPGGTVAQIDGIETVREKIPEVIRIESRYPVGSTVPNGDTLRQIMIRFVIISDDREKLGSIIRSINSNIHSIDQNGNEMLVGMQPERLYGLM